MKTRMAKQLRQSRLSLILIALLLVLVLIFAALWSAFSSDSGANPLTVRFSELMLSNSLYPDPSGLCTDWIELENYGQAPVDLSGLILTDDPDQPRFVFPSGTVVNPGEFLVIYCLSSAKEGNYAKFGLSSTGGETVSLRNERGGVFAEVTTFRLKKDQSMAWDGERWTFCDRPSPGFANTEEGHRLALESIGPLTQVLESSVNLIISELVSKNNAGLLDSDGDASDWFEITNPTEEAVSLKGLSFSTTPGDPFRWRIGADRSLAPGESLVIFASGKNRGEGEELHASFRLSSDGETLWMSDSDGLLIDSCEFPALEADQAWQLGSDGSFSKTYAATPGRSGAMTEEEKNFYSGKIVINELCASYTVGRGGNFDGQSDWIELKNLTDQDIDLQGFTLSDSDRRSDRPLSGILPAGGCILVWADKGKEALHVDFALSRNSETVTLCAPWGTPVDSVGYDLLEENQSYARGADGKFSVCVHPTPGFENTPAGLEAYYASFDSPSGLVINEVMIGNFSYLPQSYGKYYDWIEVKNLSSASVNLSSYYLSDSRDKPKLFSLPAVTLAPGECYVVLASGDESLSTKTYAHTPFKLSSKGEGVFLFTADGELADCIGVPALPTGTSYGRQDGQAGFYYFAAPTPGANNSGGKRLVADSPVSLTAVGAHEGVQSLEILLSGEGTIYYTLDGSRPGPGSKIYTDGITVDKTTVLRAYCAAEGKIDSPVVSCTYLVNESHTLPVISVSTAPDNLWDYNTGIYVKGPGASPDSPFRGANFYKDWEKPANVTFYDTDGTGFSVDCGLKIFGNTGRALDKKSFQLKFKSQYGCSKLRYNIFDNTDVNIFDSLVLRSGSQDYQSSLIRDAVISELCSQGMPETEAQDYRYCVLYLNGEYWGIYCIREKLDEDFVAAHYNVTPESVNVLGYTGTTEHGSSRDYRDLIGYINSHDLSVDEYYRYVAEKISLESYIDWFIAEAYVGNSDLDNIRFFQSPDYDGKWRWILYDFDLTFYRNANPYSYLISSSAYYSDVSLIMRNLMKNKEFKDLFLTRLNVQLKTTFSEENVLGVIEKLKTQLEQEIPRERARWNLSVSGWESAVRTLENFVKGKSGVSRTQEIINDVSSAMGLSADEIRHYFG